jgi:hypothetical protein
VKPAWPALKRSLDELYVALSLGRQASVLAQLRQIVPQFSYAGCETVANVADAMRVDVIAEISDGEPDSRASSYRPRPLDPRLRAAEGGTGG